MKKIILDEKGQTAIEYVLLIAVMSVIIFSLMGQIQKMMLGTGGECAQDDSSIICKFKKNLDLTSFKTFTLRR